MAVHVATTVPEVVCAVYSTFMNISDLITQFVACNLKHEEITAATIAIKHRGSFLLPSQCDVPVVDDQMFKQVLPQGADHIFNA